MALWPLSAWQNRAIAGKVSSREGALARYRSMLELIEGAEFSAPYLANLRGRVLPSAEAPAKASTELRRLSAIVGFLDARQNEAFRLFTGPLLMWDVHCVLALETWQRRAGKKVRPWLEVIGEFEALSSLAGFAYDHPSYVFPRDLGGTDISCEAIGPPAHRGASPGDQRRRAARGGHRPLGDRLQHER